MKEGILGLLPNTCLDLGVNDLNDHLLVGESNDETVLWRVVLVLSLGDETLPRVVYAGKEKGILKTDISFGA
jgi:hypothetical protein